MHVEGDVVVDVLGDIEGQEALDIVAERVHDVVDIAAAAAAHGDLVGDVAFARPAQVHLPLLRNAEAAATAATTRRRLDSARLDTTSL